MHTKQDTGNFLSKVEIKNYNVMIDGQNSFDHLVKNDMTTYDNTQKNCSRG